MGNAAHYRFMDKVLIQDGPIPGSPCWIWLGARSRGGGKQPNENTDYGSFKYEGKVFRAHVWASKNIGKQECLKGFERHHKCENSLCVCPDHLEIITQQQNNHHRWESGEYYKKDIDPPFFADGPA